MGAEIDSLDIRIAANAKSASQSLNTLINRLDRVNSSLSRAGGSGMATMAVGITRLASAMQTMKNVDTVVFTRLAKNIEKLSGIKSADLTNTAISINRISKSVSSLSNVNITGGTEKIAELATGIAKLGYSSSTKAIENIPKLARAMRDLVSTLSKAPKVSQNLIDMTNALANLSRTGASSGRAANALSGALNTYSTSSKKASHHTFSLAGAIGKLYASYWLLFRAMGKVKQSIDIAADIAEVQNVVNQTFGEYASLVDKASQSSIADFGMSELTLKQIASRFQAMGTAMGFTQGKMANMSLTITELAADMASFYNVEQEDVAKDLESIFTGETRPLRTFGLDLTEATLKEWAMKEGLDANISSMSQAEKAMLRYQYVMANTGAAQGDFARTAGSWSNQVRILRQNFEQLGSVLGGTLINALNPLIRAFNTAMGVIIAFAETISNALGKIFGWKFQKSGVGVTDALTEGIDGVADSANGAANNIGGATTAAKELKRELLGFDEITKLSDVTDPSGGGSGGSGSGTSGAGNASGAGGEWTQVDTIWESYESEIDTLEQLGSHIRDSLMKAMDGIDWNSVYEKARGFGTGLATFLNGLFAPNKKGDTVLGSVGTTIAGSLNSSLEILNSFGLTFNWKNFGKSIADGISKFFKTTNLNLAADTFNTYANGILDSMIEAIEGDNVEWDKIGDKIGNALKRIEWKVILLKIGKLIYEAINNALEIYVNAFNADPLETAILTAVAALKFTGLAGTLGSRIAGKIRTVLTGGTAVGKMTDIANNFGLILGGALFVAITQTAVSEYTGGPEALVASLREDIEEALSKEEWEFGVPVLVKFSNKMQQIFPWLTKNSGNETTEIEVTVEAEVEPETTEKAVQKKINKKYDNLYLPSETAVETTPGEMQEDLNTISKGLKAPFKTELETTAEEMRQEISRKVFGFVLPVLAEANIEKLNDKINPANKFLNGVLANTNKVAWQKDADKSLGVSAKTGSVGWQSGADKNVSVNAKTTKVGWGTNSDKALGVSAKTRGISWQNGASKWLSGIFGYVSKVQKDTSVGELILRGITGAIAGLLGGIGQKANGGFYRNGQWSPITAYAGGGLPDMGELFIARESGPELVGRMGGGTAIMNNNQIVASVSAGVYQAVAAAMSQFSGNSVSEVHVHLEGDAAGVFRMVKQENDRIVIATGEPALLI